MAAKNIRRPGSRAPAAMMPKSRQSGPRGAPALERKLAEGRVQRVRRWLALHALGVGIGISVGAHAMLPIIGFTLPTPAIRKAHDSGLAVVLVNAKHAKPPKKAQALAQANLEGGGNSPDPKAMPSSPLPPQAARQDGTALLDMQRKVEQLEQQQRELLRRAKGAGPALPEPKVVPAPEAPPNDDTPPNRGLDLSTASALARQEAIVSKQLSDYAKRPRKAFVGPNTREYSLAQYAEDWRIRVERVGTYNFPRNAQGSLYGSVQISVEIAPDGSVIAAEITRPDRRTPQINEAALRIIQLASPFARFPPDVSKEYNTLVITRTINFTREDITAN